MRWCGAGEKNDLILNPINTLRTCSIYERPPKAFDSVCLVTSCARSRHNKHKNLPERAHKIHTWGCSKGEHFHENVQATCHCMLVTTRRVYICWCSNILMGHSYWGNFEWILCGITSNWAHDHEEEISRISTPTRTCQLSTLQWNSIEIIKNSSPNSPFQPDLLSNSFHKAHREKKIR